jgi:aryl-alcohol dehydrogenase-like predicted oxidoreductase
MRYRQVGSSGLTVSAVGLGCNNFGMRIDADAARSVLDEALDLGITLLDTADVYGSSEDVLGVILGERRERVVLATKFGKPWADRPPDDGARGSARYIHRAVESSLRRLRTDWIDLYQMHEPDPLTPIGDTLETLSSLVTEGKVRYIGSSNFAGWQIADADWEARTNGHARFISTQSRYSIVDRTVEADVGPACAAHGVGILPWYPLENGLLTGKYARGSAAPAGTRLEQRLDRVKGDRWATVEAIGAFAEARGHTMLEAAFGGLLAQPMLASVIAGATSVDQVRANVAASGWVLVAEELAALDEITPPQRPWRPDLVSQRRDP